MPVLQEEGSLAPEAVARLEYGPPGRAVLCQGSEILHHVTPVRSGGEGGQLTGGPRSEVPRIVVILCFAPADVFRYVPPSHQDVVQAGQAGDGHRGSRGHSHRTRGEVRWETASSCLDQRRLRVLPWEGVGVRPSPGWDGQQGGLHQGPGSPGR